MTIDALYSYALSKTLYNLGTYYMTFKFPFVLTLAYAAVLIAVPLIIILVSISFLKETLA